MPNDSPPPDIDPAFYGPAAQPLPAALPEATPVAGGRYTRQPDGSLIPNPTSKD